MLSKPFKPPLLKRKTEEKSLKHPEQDVERPAKRHRAGEKAIELSKPWAKTTPGKALAVARATCPSRDPLARIKNPPSPEQLSSGPRTETYYAVLWRKYTAKKHKTWDGDGVLTIRDGYATLQDVSGRAMGRSTFSDPLLPGSTLSIGGKDIEIDSLISKADFMAGKPFSKARSEPVVLSASKTGPHVQAVKYPSQEPKSRCKQIGRLVQTEAQQHSNPVINNKVMRPNPGNKPTPRYDPDAPGALVLKRPRVVPPDKKIVDVVLDPLLGRHLRDHQREGVAFLYECVMGLRDFGGEGCILADEMGLGKTLQTIALLWTLLKQNPIHGAEPVIRKALIVCPVTLINNWQKEFRKWLGSERIGVFVADGKRTRLSDFTMGKSYSVMIIGYERLRSVAEDLNRGAGIDIVVADEGHRLRTVQNKSAQAIQSLNTGRRVILSGTPIQNDLSEFFSMVNFVNDGQLGTYKQFLKHFENPIVKSRQPNAPEQDIELGESRSDELARETSKFILRRTADVLSKYLPPKIEYVLFCNPTPTQAKVYRSVLASPMFQTALGSSESALQLITILKKICNSPSLLNPALTTGDKNATSASINSLLETLPQNLLKTLGPQASIKVRILDNLLHLLSRRTSEKIVLVSNYTSTLDLLQTLLTSLSLPFLRLDGSTPSTKRQSLVDDFNRSSSSAVFAFLLSAKAGGMGLNLIGASRLVLFDVDWNPAIEEQAMARIHRQGQMKTCRIYRFVLKGGLEERVWQRQVVKRGLASSIMDGGRGRAGADGVLGKKEIAHFSREELRDLFRLDESAGLRTHELIGCSCQGQDSSVTQREALNVDVDTEPFDLGTLDDGEATMSLAASVPDAESSDTDSPLPERGALFNHPSTVYKPSAPVHRAHKPQSGTHSAQKNGEQAQMEGLMAYIHLNTSTQAFKQPRPNPTPAELAQTSGLVDDDILMEVLRGDAEGDDLTTTSAATATATPGVAWLFKKTSSAPPKVQNPT